jgi:hypothetical protein
MLSETKHNGYREGYFLYSDVLCQVNFNVKHKRFRVAEVRAAQNKITRLSKFIEKLAIAEVDKANEFLASRSDYSLDSIMVDENPYSTMRRCLPDDNVPISEKLLVNNITFIGCGSFVECRTAIEKAIIQSTDEDIAMYISKCVAKMQPAFGGEFVRSAADAAGAASGISPEDILDLVELPANNLTES